MYVAVEHWMSGALVSLGDMIWYDGIQSIKFTTAVQKAMYSFSNEYKLT